MSALIAHLESESVRDDRGRLRSGGLRVGYLALALIICTLVVFAQVVTFEFLMWDDESFVVPHLRRFGGLTADSVTWALTNAENGWRTPISYLSLFCDAQWSGSNPAGYHLSNALIHLASTLLLFVALARMTGAAWTSALTAALFAVHPLHVEPVAWVTGRWELLCGFFWILGIWAYAAYCRQPGVLRYLLVVASLLLALLSKPMAVTFPFALLLLDYWPLRRLFPTATAAFNGKADLQEQPGGRGLRDVLLEKVPLLAVSIAVLCISLFAKRGFLSQRGMHGFSLGERVGNGLETYAVYVVQFFWPTKLSFYYPHPALFGELTSWRVLGAGAFVAAVTLTAAVLCRRAPYVLVGWLWYVGVFVPAIGLFQVEHHARADRYTYLPLIGLGVAGAWAVWHLARSFPRLKVPLTALALLTISGLIVVAKQQTARWRDNESLFTYAVGVDSRNFKALTNLGVMADQQRRFAVAEAWFRRSLAVLPGDSFARYRLGQCLYRQGKTEPALIELERALTIDPTLTSARRALAEALESQGDREGALKQYEEIVRRAPNRSQSHLWLGKALARRRDFAGSSAAFRRALQLDASGREAPLLLGAALASAGRAGEAAQFYDSYLEQYPQRTDMANALAWLLATSPDPDARSGGRAVAAALGLCRQSGFRDPRLLDTLAAAYAEAGQFAQATQTATRALRLARQAEDEPFAQAVASRLAVYQNGKPYRQSFPEPAQQGATPVTAEFVQ